MARRPHQNMLLVELCLQKRKSRPIPSKWKPARGPAIARAVPIVRRSSRGNCGYTNADGAAFDSLSRPPSKFCAPGSCAGDVPDAEEGLPTTHPFALPQKRFVKQEVLQRAKDYLGTELSYRSAVQHRSRVIQYDQATAATMDKDPLPAVQASTLWHWLSWLSELPNTLAAASALIRQKDPGCTLHREPWAVAPHKYRSQQRQHQLQQAMRLLTTAGFFERLFGREIFPCFATAHRWR